MHHFLLSAYKWFTIPAICRNVSVSAETDIKADYDLFKLGIYLLSWTYKAKWEIIDSFAHHILQSISAYHLTLRFASAVTKSENTFDLGQLQYL